MRLETRLSLVLAGSACAMLALAAGVESGRLRQHARSHAAATARAVTEELQRSLDVRLDGLSAMAAELARGGTPQTWAAPLAAPLGPEVGVFVVEAGGALRRHTRSAEPSLQALEPWLAASSLVTGAIDGVQRAGLVHTPLGTILATTASLGASGDQLLLVRPVDLASLARGLGGVEVEFLPATDGEVPDADRLAFADLVRGRAEHRAEDERGAYHYSGMRDAEGRLVYVAKVYADRADVSLQRAALRDTLVWMLASAVVAVVLLHRLLRAHVVAPLRALQQHAARIGRSENGRIEIRMDRNDEFGELARALDGMLRALDATRQNIVENARHVGMSDISKGVVHSIGNVLTSVNVSAQFIARELDAVEIGDLRAQVDELRQHADDLGVYVTEDPQGRRCVQSLDAMTSSLEDFQTRCKVELEAVEKGVDHVVKLVRSIDRPSVGASVTEAVDLAAVIEAALGIACLAHNGGRDVEIVREFGSLERPTLDRQKLTTVLIHVLSNALESLRACSNAQKRLEIATYDAGHGRFVIEITDSGASISPAHLDTLFAPGFTTKAGAAGEGLHTVASLCRELGVSIGATSDGPGTGATFKLRVPYVPPAVAELSREPLPILPSISGSTVQFDRRRSTRPPATSEAQ